MSVLTLAVGVAQAPPGIVPCRTNESELWFAEDETSTRRAQQMCRACPLQAACLTGAMDRNEPWGVWGGEIFERGEVVAQRKPRGRPRKDAELIAQRAQDRLADRLSVVGAA
jgi:WhiB family transcriptional regulator, redox-sensing transcriptional regulator